MRGNADQITPREAFVGLRSSPDEIAFVRAKLKPSLRRVWAAVRPGRVFTEALGPTRTGGRQGFTVRKLDPDAPGWTVLADSRALVHWREPRVLTIAEVRRLCSFPDDYQP